MTLAVHRIRRTIAASLIGVLAALAVVVLGQAPAAHAASNVSVTVEGRSDLVAVADPTYLTELRVTGSGFQSIVNGFGGIYVVFGWVSGPGWQPSQGGTTGANYRYVPDDEMNPTGYASFVAFPGSTTEAVANGGEVSTAGDWSAVLSVPGGTFTALDRNGNPTQVNCLEVQCGVITIGAHGVINSNNETFTPVNFRDLYTEAGASGTVPVAPEAQAQAPVAPVPATTTYVTEVAAAPVASSTDDGIVTILLWAVLGVGVLALASVVFLVWAVLSGRKRSSAVSEVGSGTDSGTGQA